LHGAVWSATARAGARVSAGRECAVAVLNLGEGERAATQRRRLAALVGAGHEHLAEVLEVIDVPTGCAVVSERLEGPTLAVLRVSRAPLALSEVASLLGPLADALAHLHRHGVTHGDVSPANVVLAAPDRPVLVDLAGEVAFEAGTAGFRAPERVAGGPAGPASDVWSLATLALWLLDPADRAQAEVVLRPALHPEPRERCGAAALASLADRLGEPKPPVLPGADSLAQGSLRASAALGPTEIAPRRLRPVGRTRDRTGAGGAGLRARHRGGGARGRRLLVAVSLALAAAAGLGMALPTELAVGLRPLGQDLAEREPDTAAAPLAPGASPGAASRDPGGASSDGGARYDDAQDAALLSSVEELLRRRDEAINSGDVDALAALSTPGSAAADADRDLGSALAAGSQVEGLHTVLVAAEVLEWGRSSARVAVVTRQPGHRRTELDGRVVAVPGQAERCAVLELDNAGSSPRVREVAACTGDEGPSPAHR
jgi:hypothetical protein